MLRQLPRNEQMLLRAHAAPPSDSENARALHAALREAEVAALAHLRQAIEQKNRQLAAQVLAVVAEAAEANPMQSETDSMVLERGPSSPTGSVVIVDASDPLVGADGCHGVPGSPEEKNEEDDDWELVPPCSERPEAPTTLLAPTATCEASTAGPLLPAAMAGRRFAGRGRDQRRRRKAEASGVGDTLPATSRTDAHLAPCIVGVTASPAIRSILRAVARFYGLNIHPQQLANHAARPRPVLASAPRATTRGELEERLRVSVLRLLSPDVSRVAPHTSGTGLSSGTDTSGALSRRRLEM